MSKLEVIPLGGVGEFGMNCAALRCGNDMILIDAGITFPSRHLGRDLGIDQIVPDISFLKEGENQLRAIILTHGHEDHAGAVSYILKELQVPVYASPLTLGLVASRLRERKLEEKAQLFTLESRKPISLGPFQVEPLSMTHSFPDNFCLAITTPVGKIIWTGDFKFDQTPIDGRLSDVSRLSQYGEDGVLALFSDSTNSDVPGLSPSEFTTYEPLRSLFRKATRRIVFSCFSSSIHRIQILMDLAEEFGRKVLPVGRSMLNNTRVALELGHLRGAEDLLVTPVQARELPREQLVILASGSQGEPMAALSRLAVNEFKGLQVEEEDLVILSARIIPGNEKAISSLINHFYRRGTRVYDSRFSQIHVSGHGFRDDLKLMINLTRPRFFVPIHGEFKQLKNHAWLAADQGIPTDRIRLIENGDVLEFSGDSSRVTDQVDTGRRFLGAGFHEEVHDLVLRDRRHLSEDGFVVVVLRVDRFKEELLGDPELISRGFVLTERAETLMQALRQEVVRIVDAMPLEEKKNEDLLEKILRKELRRFIRKQTGKRPMILPVTMEI